MMRIYGRGYHLPSIMRKDRLLGSVRLGEAWDYYETMMAGRLKNLSFHSKNGGEIFEYNRDEYRKYTEHRVQRSDKTVTVTVPSDVEDETDNDKKKDIRESIRMQSLLSIIGLQMGFSIWIPKNDRTAVTTEMNKEDVILLDRLPLNYNDTTLKTIEQIDVLWIKKRAIMRAFEVEHTTSIYSGILNEDACPPTGR